MTPFTCHPNSAFAFGKRAWSWLALGWRATPFVLALTASTLSYAQYGANREAPNAGHEAFVPISAIADGDARAWLPLRAAPRTAHPIRLCALLPHGENPYWVGVAWGLADQADAIGVAIGIYEAGGYGNVETQRQQWRECLARGADALIVAAMVPEGFAAEIEATRRARRSLIDFNLGLASEAVTSRVLVDYQYMGRPVAQSILDGLMQDVSAVGWLPGPEGNYWMRDAEAGVRQALAPRKIPLESMGHANVFPELQRPLIQQYVAKNGWPRVILGHPAGIVAAAQLSRALPVDRRPVLGAFYATAPVIDLIREGRVAAAASDSPVLQARLAVDVAVRAAAAQPVPRRLFPHPTLLTPGNIRARARHADLAPEGVGMTRRELPAVVQAGR